MRHVWKNKWIKWKILNECDPSTKKYMRNMTHVSKRLSEYDVITKKKRRIWYQYENEYDNMTCVRERI